MANLAGIRFIDDVPIKASIYTGISNAYSL